MTSSSTWARSTGSASGFAGVLAIMLGGFNVIEGFFALFNDKYVALANGQFYVLDRTGWGWAHIILGLILGVVGFAIMAGQGWARVTGIVIAVLAGIVQMLYVPMYPFWSLINIGILVLVIYSLTKSSDSPAG
jgi:hypothetical protein